MAPSPLHCNRAALKSHCIALHSHCIAIALHCNRIAMQPHPIAIALRCVAIALHYNRIALQSHPSTSLLHGPLAQEGEPTSPPPLLALLLPSYPWALGKTEDKEEDGQTVPSHCAALQSQRIALQSHCNSRFIAPSLLHCVPIALRCNRIALHCIAIEFIGRAASALQSVALQPHCITLQSDCICYAGAHGFGDSCRDWGRMVLHGRKRMRRRRRKGPEGFNHPCLCGSTCSTVGHQSRPLRACVLAGN